MSNVNQGRNEIRFNNSGGKCLLENWVEERAVQSMDTEGEKEQTTFNLLKSGNKGLLTTNLEGKVEDGTTFRESYRKQTLPNVRQKGSKRAMMEQKMYEQISQEVDQEYNSPPEVAEYSSVMSLDYNKPDFVSQKPPPTASHDYISEQPVTYWSEHKERVQGTTQFKTVGMPFRKNAAFTHPIGEYMDQPKPYEQEMWPNM